MNGKQVKLGQETKEHQRKKRAHRRRITLSGLEEGSRGIYGYSPDDHPISIMNDINYKYENIPANFGPEGFHGDFANRYGFSDKEIIGAQKHLMNLGYDIGKTGADGKWGPATRAAYKEYLGAYKYGYTDSDILKQNHFNKEVRAYMKKRAEKYSKYKKTKKTEDTLIDSMKSIKY
tara:strand:- start:108 stop:635 length:528 start_codon:yes stop_codon:yes gene_type:complete